MDRRQQGRGAITPSARGTGLTALQILQGTEPQFLLLLLHYPHSEKISPSPHLESFFQANPGIFPLRILKADDRSSYRNLLCIRTCIACTQACISKCNSFSFPPLASFAELSHLCGSPPDLQAWPFSSCLAPHSTPQCSGKQLSALSYTQSFCNDDWDRDLTPFLKPQDTGDLLERAIPNSPPSPHTTLPAVPLLAFGHSRPDPLQSHHHTFLFPIPHHVAQLIQLFTKMIWNAAPKP